MITPRRQRYLVEDSWPACALKVGPLQLNVEFDVMLSFEYQLRHDLFWVTRVVQAVKCGSL